MANRKSKTGLSKHFYGQESNIQVEIPISEAGPALKFFFFLAFGMAFGGFLLLGLGLWKEIHPVILAGVLLICFMTYPMLHAIGLSLTEEQRTNTAFRICRVLFPGIGTLIAAAILGAQFVSDLTTYILTISGIALPAIFIGCGILVLCISKKQDARYGRCTAEVWATVTDLREHQNRMVLSDDIHTSSAYDPVNFATYYTPVFRYDFNGQTYEESPTVNSGDLNQNLTVGEQIKLRINPDNPKEMAWLPTSRNFAPVIGILMLAGGILCGAIEAVVALFVL